MSDFDTRTTFKYVRRMLRSRLYVLNLHQTNPALTDITHKFGYEVGYMF